MRTTRGLLLFGFLAASLATTSARAQTTTTNGAQDGEFGVQRFEPAPGTKNFLSVETLRMDGAMGFSVGAMFNYARNPFVLRSCVSQTDCSAPNATNISDIPVVTDLYTWDLLAAISPIRRLQIGLRFPFTYVNGSGVNLTTGQPLEGGLKGFGLGDAALEAKYRIFGGAQDPYVAGAGIDIAGPLGHATAENKYIGSSSPITVGVRGIFDGEVKNFSFGLNLRALIRQDAQIASTTIGPEFRYGVGAGYRLTPIVRVVAEGYGGTRFSSKNGTNSLEIDGAIEVQPLSVPILVRVGGGAGVLQGVGVPAARGLVGITFVHDIGDQDGDGIPDDKDKCPTLPEDKDGFEDTDGCPDLDNDQDHIPDDRDKCPNQPETINGFQDADGCPDEVSDRDKDGIPDTEDKCPDEIGGDPKLVIRTPGPNYGCLDTDHDGVPDKLDKCPTEPEDTDGFEDTDGCPDPDNDKDGIPDERDECIDKPETYNGFQDADGCPDEAPNKPKTPSLVNVTGDQIQILQRVEFATGSDKITGATSFKVLDAVVDVLKSRRDITKIEVAGHTDNVGNADANRKLSQKRADAVVKYLVDKGGIDKARLVGKGYGPDKPVEDNKTNAGRQKNRRVEFNIVKDLAAPAAAPASGAAPATPPAPPAGAPATPPATTAAPAAPPKP